MASLDSDGITQFDVIDLTDVTGHVACHWSAREDRVWVRDLGPRMWILGDVAGIEAALDAMVENAIHHTQPGDVIRLTCQSTDGGAILEVADSGPGIPEEHRSLVFQRFWHRTPPDGVVGSGLGLSMVLAIAQAHGGDAVATVAPEGGAAVRMTLPRQVLPVQQATDVTPEPAAEPRPSSGADSN